MNQNKPLQSIIFTQSSGFTLIEVLVALTIFTVVAVTASIAASDYTRATGHLKQKTYAHFVAKNRMAEMLINQELQSQQGISNSAQKNKVVKTFGSSWQVGTSVTDTDLESLKKITVSVALNADDTTAGVDKTNQQPVTDIVFYQYKHIIPEPPKEAMR